MSMKHYIVAAALGSSLGAQATDTYQPERIDQNDQRIVTMCEKFQNKTGILLNGKEVCEYSLDNGKSWKQYIPNFPNGTAKIAGGGLAGLLLLLGAGIAIMRYRRKDEYTIASNIGEKYVPTPQTNSGISGKNKGGNHPDTDPTINVDDLLDQAMRANPRYQGLGHAIEQANNGIDTLPPTSQIKTPTDQVDILLDGELTNKNQGVEDAVMVISENNNRSPDEYIYVANMAIEHSFDHNDAEDVLLKGLREYPDHTGIYNKLESILRNELVSNPDDIKTYKKLLSVYYITKDIKKFKDIYMADDVAHFHINQKDDDMMEIRTWGRDISPGDDAYLETSSSTVIPQSEGSPIIEIVDGNPANNIESPQEIIDQIIPASNDQSIKTESVIQEGIREKLQPSELTDEKKEDVANLIVSISKMLKKNIELGYGFDITDNNGAITLSAKTEGGKLYYLNADGFVEETRNFTAENVAKFKVLGRGYYQMIYSNLTTRNIFLTNSN